MRRRSFLLLLAVLMTAGSCVQDPGTVLPSAFEPQINAGLAPRQSSILDAEDKPQPLAASRDAQGVQSDFVEGLVLVRPNSPTDLDAFLARYDGVVIADDTIPEPPAALGITLTAEQRQPTEYVVRVNLARADTTNFAANGTAAGVSGVVEYSTPAGLQTIAVVADAVAAGFNAAPDYIDYPQQVFPAPLFSTQERGGNDAFTLTRANGTGVFDSGGSQSNVSQAWQFLSAHGIQRRVLVAIIDNGFWLNTNGTARSATDSDFPPGVPLQYDFIGNDAFADGANANPCGAGNPCFWHGTGAASVAMGVLNNNAGAAGTGGQVGDPILFRMDGTRPQRNRAIRTAVAWGADVISISSGRDCNFDCRQYDSDNTPFDDAVDAGSRVVFLSSAGNGEQPAGTPPGTPSVGYDVEDPHFYHPCTEDHVICVGALADGATTKIGYSNFGAHVQIFAPTNIPVMSYPPSTTTTAAGATVPLLLSQAFGAEQAQTFGGTSAATPFVAGVAAMVKAINPELTGDQVAAILRETAHPGVGNVSRYVDAYAAVRRAAQGVPAVKDRFENNDLEANPTNLIAAAPHNQPNLNLDRANDLDYFRVDAPGSSIMQIDVQYMQELGSMDLLKLETLGACAAPVYFSDEGLLGRGHRWEYTVSGGPQQFALRGADINAYNLLVSFRATASLPPDIYESNNVVSAARYIRSFKSGGAQTRARSEARVTIDASIHAMGDVDYYIVRGSPMSLAEQVLLVGSPAVTVYGNESQVTLEVWKLNADNTQGAAVGSATGLSCTAQPVSVRLDGDQFYLVRVTGGVGRYKLRNGISTQRRDIPILVLDPIYIILHPLDPIEHVLRFPEKYIVVADAAYSGIRVTSPAVHLELYNGVGSLIAQGLPSVQGVGERLSLAGTTVSQIYAVVATPLTSGSAAPTLQLEWEQTASSRVSANLIVNPGAEIVVGPDPAQEVPYWNILEGTPRIFFYDAETQNPSPSGPGPADRGMHLFAGGPAGALGTLRQTVSIDAGWRQAIDAGRVQARLSAYLGGALQEGDDAGAMLTFLGANFQTLGTTSLSSVTALDRENQTGLFLKETSEVVPVGTFAIYVDLLFRRTDGEYNNGYADNVELILSDYTP